MSFPVERVRTFTLGSGPLMQAPLLVQCDGPKHPRWVRMGDASARRAHHKLRPGSTQRTPNPVNQKRDSEGTSFYRGAMIRSSPTRRYTALRKWCRALIVDEEPRKLKTFLIYFSLMFEKTYNFQSKGKTQRKNNLYFRRISGEQDNKHVGNGRGGGRCTSHALCKRSAKEWGVHYFD